MDWHSPREWIGVILKSTKRIVVLVIGLALVVGGIVLLVLPGPGLLLIIAGLAVLASEFAWAERLLDRAKEQANKAKDKAQKSWRGRRRS
ncbi:MAG: PGPGW domain-containing protein [Acidimicrobiales bacterium]|nr:PGPGW domain-containing protein [Acidimicrobiales bacterium]